MKLKEEIFMKKTVVFLALVIAVGAAKAGAEEVTGTILFEPERTDKPLISFYEYLLDTTGSKVHDRSLFINNMSNLNVFRILPRYLQQGSKVIFEDKDLKPFQDFLYTEIIGLITLDGRIIELSQLFAIDDIKRSFPKYYAKLQREGRAR
jgi:hypothetical protein